MQNVDCLFVCVAFFFFLGVKRNQADCRSFHHCETDLSSVWSHSGERDGDERAGRGAELSEKFCGGVYKPAGPR